MINTIHTPITIGTRVDVEADGPRKDQTGTIVSFGATRAVVKFPTAINGRRTLTVARVELSNVDS